MNTEALALTGVVKAELARGSLKIELLPAAAEITPVVLKGEKEYLRYENEILAVNELSDIFLGYNVELTEALFEPSAFALANGWQQASTEGLNGIGAMEIGNGDAMTLKLYTEEKNTDGETADTLCFEFTGCRGRSNGFILKDGLFVTPKLFFESRPDKGEAVLTVTSLVPQA